MYKWQQVRALKARGVGIKKIARLMKVSKNTVRKYLRSTDPPQFKTRSYDKKLDPYSDEIERMLRDDYIGTRIHAELTDRGMDVSLSTVHREIRRRQQEQRIREKVTTRFETDPGQQMQYDWKEWLLPVGNGVVKIYVHENVLSYSRKKHYTFSLSIKTNDVIRAMGDAVEYFGGVARDVVIDNPKQMVVTHRKDGVILYNEEFVKFCGLYGIEPQPCRTYRARTKGKAERPLYYLQEHLLRGLRVKDLQEFDGKLRAFTDRYNGKVHCGLGETPERRYQREKEHLRPLPKVESSVLYERLPYKVSNDGYLCYGGRFYPLPMALCLTEVWVESVYGRLLRVYDVTGQMVREIAVDPFGTAVKPLHSEHVQRNEAYRQNRQARTSAVVQRFVETFDRQGVVYLEGLKQRIGPNLYWHLSEILQYADVYGTHEVSEVLGECIDIGTYHKNSVKRLLARKKPQRPDSVSSVSVTVVCPVVITRDLSAYRVEMTHE